MLRNSKGDESERRNTGTLPELPLMFQRGCTLSSVRNWFRQQYCRPTDPWDDWELKDSNETELSLADFNFVKDHQHEDGTVNKEEEEVCRRRVVDFAEKDDGCKLLHPSDLSYATAIMDESDLVFEKKTKKDTSHFDVANVSRACTDPNVTTSSQINDSTEPEKLKRELFGSEVLNEREDLTLRGVSGCESLHAARKDKELRVWSQDSKEKLEEWTNAKAQLIVEGQSNQQTLHMKDQKNTQENTLDELEVFLIELSESEASLCKSLEAEKIKHDVEKIVSHVCNNLKAYKMFRDCTLLKTGSTYEGVKIGKPDEFDFMIVLPALADDGIMQFSQNKYLEWHLAYYKIMNKGFFSDLFAQNARQDHETEVEGEIMEDEFMASVRDQVKSNIEEQLKSGQLLSTGWEFVEIPTINAFTLPRMAVTPILKWTGNEFKDLYISIDLSFAIPLKKIPLWTFGRKLFLRSCQTLSVSEEGRYDVLLPESDQVSYVLIRDSTRCRFSFSCQEQDIMNRCGDQGGEKRCFRLAKCLRDFLIDQTFDPDLQQLKSPISTYWLKTIMYYQLKKHQNDPHAWSFGHLGNRVLDIFQVLHLCLVSSKLQSYFIPGYNLLFLKDVQVVTSKVQEVIDLLNGLKNGQVTRQHMRQQMEAKKTANEDLLYRERREHLMNLFYVYAYNDYQSEDLQTITTSFINRFFPDKMKVFGEGKNLRLVEAGCSVDIDKELENIYGEKFSYFR